MKSFNQKRLIRKVQESYAAHYRTETDEEKLKKAKRPFINLNYNQSMPRRTHWNDHTLPISSDTKFTDRAGRSRRAFKIKEPRLQWSKHVAIAVAVMVVACGVIYLLAF